MGIGHRGVQIRMTAIDLHFDQATHVYRLGDRVLPSVTQVLKEAGIIDDTWYTEESRIRGSFAHEATALDDAGVLDESSVDSSLAGYLEAWRRFKRDSGMRILKAEFRICDRVYGYAGTVDRLAVVRHQPTIPDIKTGDPEPWHALQLAGYARCVPGRPMRMGVYLHDDGKYTTRTYTDPSDDAAFLACVGVANWKRRFMR